MSYTSKHVRKSVYNSDGFSPQKASDYTRVRTEEEFVYALQHFRSTLLLPAIIEQTEGESLPSLRLYVGQTPWTFYDTNPSTSSSSSGRRRETYKPLLKSPEKPAKTKSFGDTLQGSWHGPRMKYSTESSSSKRESEADPGSSRKKRGGPREEFHT
jgi:hypothetical protein